MFKYLNKNDSHPGRTNRADAKANYFTPMLPQIREVCKHVAIAMQYASPRLRLKSLAMKYPLWEFHQLIGYRPWNSISVCDGPGENLR